jgi:DNA invertase Pin-like site-specific DNA recombinase
MDAVGDNSNGKVTMAVLATKIDRLIEDNHELRQMLSDYQAVKKQVDISCAEIDTLRGQTKAWGIGNGLAAVVAAIIGVKIQ